MLALSIDVGTSVIKAVAFDSAGRERAVARRPTRVLHPSPGFAEQDMHEVWSAVAETLRAVRDQAPGSVDLIALTAQGDGCWLVDAAGEPVRPAVLWNDGRNRELVERWERDGTLERAFRINGSITFPGLANAILRWLSEEEPEAVERAHRALTCGGWIFSRLTGELAVDESDASAPFLDLRAREYAQELLALFELQWAQALLPEIRSGAVGALRASAAAALGLPAGTPVVMAPYDIVAMAIGVGACAPGQACGLLGTTLCTETVVDRVDTQGPPAGCTISTTFDDRLLRAYPSMVGTKVVTWMMRLLGVPDPAAFSALAARAGRGPAAPLVLPYLSPAGERAPFLDPSARGLVLGLTFEHGPEDLAFGVIEGLSHVVRDCLEAAGPLPAELRLCGGGAGSELWCQLIADVTGVPTLRATNAEVGAKGAYLAALVAVGAEPDIDAAAARLVTLRDRFEPRDDHRQLHAERFERFLDTREVCAPAWRRLDGGTSLVSNV